MLRAVLEILHLVVQKLTIIFINIKDDSYKGGGDILALFFLVQVDCF
jgi:hypothetical protein